MTHPTPPNEGADPVADFPADQVAPMTAELRAQVLAQFDVIRALCSIITETHANLATLVPTGAVDDLLKIWGRWSADLMEHLGDVCNGMDIVEAGDGWMGPVFKTAHSMFPAESIPRALAQAPKAEPSKERKPDARDKLSLHELNKEGFTPYALRRLGEALWKPGPILDSIYQYANQWEHDAKVAQAPKGTHVEVMADGTRVLVGSKTADSPLQGLFAPTQAEPPTAVLTEQQAQALRVVLDHYAGDPRVACLLPLLAGTQAEPPPTTFEIAPPPPVGTPLHHTQWLRPAPSATAAPRSVWRHVKTGREYEVICGALAEATHEMVVVYRGPDSVEWVRPAREFFDGRFVFVRDWTTGREGAAEPPAGWKCRLDEEASALLRDTIGEGEASPVTLGMLTVEGVTGLNIWLTDYPEEGAILLAASPAAPKGAP